MAAAIHGCLVGKCECWEGGREGRDKDWGGKMATTGGGGMLVGELHNRRYVFKETLYSRPCPSRMASHEFLPSTSHSCVARNARSVRDARSVRGMRDGVRDGRKDGSRCTWRYGSRASMAQTSMAVQLREVEGVVSENLLEEMAQELCSKQNGGLGFSSSSPRQALSEEAAGHVSNDAPMMGYFRTLNALKGKQNGLEGEDGVPRKILSSLENLKGNKESIGSSGGVSHPKKRVWRSRKNSYSNDSKEMRERVIQVAKSIDESVVSIESIMGQPGLNVSPRFSGILKCLKNQDRALDFFNWMLKQGKTTGNIFSYNVAYRILAGRQEWSRIDELLGIMSADECEPDSYTFNTLVQGASKARNVERATKYFREMVIRGIPPSEGTYSSIMMVYQRFGMVDEAEYVYSHMVASGKHSCMTYSSMITIYTRGGLFEKSEEVMEDMKRNNVVPDRDNQLKQLNAYGQQGKIKEAEEVMEAVEQSGMHLGIVGYNSMITAYGKAGLYDKAVGLFQKLKDAGLQPDEVTYSCMIGACGRAGKLKDALNFFEEMKSFHIRPTPSNYSTLISLYGKAGNVVGVVRVIADMKKYGCKPDWQTLDAVVKAYERAGQTKKVTQVLGLLRDAGWVQEVGSYGTLLHIYLKCNLQQEALQVFSDMRKADMAPKEYMCRSLICACKDAGLYDDAVYVFKEMQIAGVRPSMESSCTMINIYGLKGDVKEAEELFSLLRNSRQQLDIIAYNVIMNVYMRSGMHEEATRVFKLMEEQDGLFPDSYTFHSMLRLSQKCNLAVQAEEVYWKLIYSDVELDEVMCNCVINCCGKFLPVEEMHRIFQQMNDAGFAPNNITFNVMIDLYGKAGMLDR